MMSPSDEKRIVAMVDSFTKTVACNFSRNLKRAKANAEKHYSDEPVDYRKERHAFGRDPGELQLLAAAEKLRRARLRGAVLLSRPAGPQPHRGQLD